MMYGTIRELKEAGISLNGIARKLNEEGSPSPSGKVGSWTATSVRNLLERVGMGL
jgi:hypothetical protein